MNNQLTETNFNKNSTLKIIITAIIIALCAVSIWWIAPINNNDPYIEQVMSYEGNPQRGEAIFNVNCASCHGIKATGNVGPNLLGVSRHKSQRRIIKQVVSGKTPPMPKFQPSAEDMADLLSYIEKLS